MGVQPEIRMERCFTVEAPPEQVWAVLSDASVLAASLPRAQLRLVDGVHTGRIELDSERAIACEATLLAVDRDDDDHVTTVSIRGRQLGGPGIGSATVRSRLAAEGSGTRISLDAEVLVTGYEKGSGFENGARALFEAAGDRLQERARRAPLRPAPADAPAPAVVQPPVPALVNTRASRQKQLICVAAGALVAAALFRGLRRRSR